MLRFSHAVLLCLVASGLALGCGDKINPKRDSKPAPTGGTGGTVEIDSGAPSEAGVALVSYSQTIAPMIKASCAVNGCHNSTDKAFNFVFDTYDGLKKDVADANNAIQSKSMPISPGADLTDAQRKQFQDWVLQGALNN